MKRIQIAVVIAGVLFLTACKKWWSHDEEDNNPYQGMSAQTLFTQAESALTQKEYQTAIRRLEALDSMYPFSNYAEKAQLDLLYAYYQKEDFASSAATAERYIHLYPRSKRVDYAYYMKAMANFQQSRGFYAKALPLDESWRDPGTQQEAYSDFSIFVQRFPQSPYSADATQRMIYLRNMFANRELHNAKYYYERKMYVAAVERAKFLLRNFAEAPSAQEALALLYYANTALGLKEAAEDALAVYQATYHATPKNLHL